MKTVLGTGRDMSLERRVALLHAGLVGWFWLTSLGCTGDVQASINVVPPEPVPKPVRETAGERDEDQDGIADDVDQCVGEKEDGLAPSPEDGCKSAPPEPTEDPTEG